MPRSIVPALAALLTLSALAGCGGTGPATAASAEEAVQRGNTAMEARRYDRAVEHFAAALDFGRATAVAREAQLGLARALAGDRQHLRAGQEYTRFIEFYPDDPRREEVEFERVRTYAALSPQYELDQTDTQTAIDYIRVYLQRYPSGAHTTEAAALLDVLTEKLARKRYESARLYERRDLYEAAVLTYRSVLEDYPASTWADDAMVGALRAQVRFAEESVLSRQAERFAAAVEIYGRIQEVFPNSPLLPEAAVLRDRAEAGRRSAEARAGG
jgi:outer membrane protein assembly factor BamD